MHGLRVREAMATLLAFWLLVIVAVDTQITMESTTMPGLFTYSSSAPSNASCGGQLSGEVGQLSSPNYPNVYAHEINCWWLITVETAKTVHLIFFNLDLENSTDCNKDLVSLYDGSSTLSPIIAKHCGFLFPRSAKYQSTSNQMFVHMETDGSGTGRGFRARFSVNDDYAMTNQICGGDLSGESGVLTSPNYPDGYPNGTACYWRITVPSSNVVNLTFVDFDTGNSTECSSFVILYDGLDISSPPIFTGCGSALPNPDAYQSLSNKMIVGMVTGSSESGFVFKATYSMENSSSVNQRCGGQLSGEIGLLTSPNYPSSYPGDSDCGWLITVPTSSIVRLTFLSFDLQDSPRCISDYVSVYDGPNTTSSLIVRQCGLLHLRFNPVYSTSNQMYLRMFTDGSGTGSGFTAKFTADSSGFVNRSCGGVLSGETGLLTSPNYPDSYPNGVDCRWLIIVPASHNVTITFLDFDLEEESTCSYDYVALYDGPSVADSRILKHCGSLLPNPVSYQSTSNQMYLRLVTDSSVTKRGFRATYSINSSVATNQTCGGELSGETGLFNSPNYPGSYPGNADCRWLITVPATYTVTITFLDFGIQSSFRCDRDYVALYDGSSVLDNRIIQKCGSSIPRPASYQSTSNQMYVRMVTDSSVTGRGFRARYSMNSSTNPSQNCSHHLNGISGLLLSPSYPSDYPYNSNCGWLITAPSSHTVHLTFMDLDFGNSTECTDFVSLHDGSSGLSFLLVKVCGNVLPSPASFQSTSNQMYAQMSTGRTGSGRGFVARYSVKRSHLNCGRQLTGQSGIVTSPNYPSDYPHSRDCGWVITVQSPLIVNLTFLDFELEFSATCSFDEVAIYDGPAISYPKIASLCGHSMPRPASYYSSSNQMYIHFNTDGSGAERGFRARYNASIPIPRIDFGIITSLNYPDIYPEVHDKKWKLTVASSHNVYLIFLDFDIEGSCTCSNDVVTLYDGSSTSAPKITKLCGQGLPRPIAYESTSNHMIIHMSTDVNIGGRGFKAVYYGKNCGGLLSGLSGSLTSPNYPMNYPDGTSCLWRIVLPAEYHIQLTVHDMHLPSGQNCNQDGLEIYGGPDDSAQELATFCHNKTTSQMVTSAENIMIVRFRSDSSVGSKGFSASYVAQSEGCGGEFSSSSGVLISENHPQDYPHNVYCLWRITVQKGYSVKLNFTAFDVELHSSCAYDWVEIFDGTVTDSKRLIKHCGSGLPIPSQYQSSSNVMYLRMKTGHSGTAPGFRAEYTSVCGDIMSEESGTLTSPNYPDTNPNQETCAWKIISSPDSRIELTINDLNLVKHENCRSGKLEIYGGPYVTSPTLSTLCHVQSTSQIITSTQNGMLIKFQGNSPGSRLSASYRRVPERCGGTYSSRSGVIMAQIHPQSSTPIPDCRWLITVESGRSVIFRFTDFEIGISHRGVCLTGDVTLFDGNNQQGTEMLKHCGVILPAVNTYTSTSNNLYIRMQTYYYTSGKGFKAEYTSSTVRCGRRGKPQGQQMIHGGQRAARYDAPWQVAFHIANSTNSSRFFCGGTVISEYWVLSAAHCFCHKNISAINVTVGRLGKYEFSKEQQTFKVADLIVHENYNPSADDYDIALVKVKPIGSHAIQFNDYVEPACLPSARSVYSSRNLCYISGWGETETGLTNNLREATATIVNSRICNGSTSFDGYITPRMVCAGSLDAVEGTCYGDSGGPLVCSENGRFTLYGVTSFGARGCSRVGFPSVFANVKYLLNWIAGKTGV